MLEKSLETKIAREVKKRRGIAYKFSSPSRRGVADRLILFPDGKSCFLEVKRPGQVATPQQKKFIRTVQKLGHKATWVDSFEDAVDFLDEVQNP